MNQEIQLFSLFLFPYMKPAGKKYTESVSNFIDKTYNILENQENSHIIAWTPRGTSFLIKDIKKFQDFILPIYFKHSNFSSFVRQLNMYNFHKVRGDRLDCEFEHEKFKKGQRDLLSKIKRKQSESFIVSQNAIEDQQGNQSQQQSSQNFKKYEGIMNFDFLGKDIGNSDSPCKNEPSQQQIQTLRRQNKNLRTIKQNKLCKQKQLNTSNNTLMGEKFFKLITCLLAEKLQKQLNIDKIDKVREQPHLLNFTFDQIIEHVLSNGQVPMQFCQYSQTAKKISSQQSDYNFMMNRASKNSQSIGQTSSHHKNQLYQ